MPRYATIDVGSNSVLLLIAEKTPAGNWHFLEERSEISRLGENLQNTSNLKPEAMERTIAVLSEYVKIAHNYKVEQIVAAGTMALRSAQNSTDFIDKAVKECGLEVEIIPGTEEARLSFLAVQKGLHIQTEQILVFDVGGGSTEFILGDNESITDKISLNIGAIRLTENILTSNPVTIHELLRASVAIERDLEDWIPPKGATTYAGIGGTITTITAVAQKMVAYDSTKIQGMVLQHQEIIRQIEMYQAKTLAERQEIAGLSPKRADIILAGALIVHAILHKVKAREVMVSAQGLRHGILYDRFGN